MPAARFPTIARCFGLAYLGLVVGCGGSMQGERADRAGLVRASSYVPCEDPAEVRLAPNVCFDPVGTRWQVVASAPGGQLDFSLELMAGGRVRATDHPAANPGTDEWIVEDDLLRIFLGNRYVEYRARLLNGSVFVGTAQNVRGDRWEFRANRERTIAECRGNELVVREGDEPGCYSAAGSRWLVSLEGRSFTIELAGNGAMTSDDPSDTSAGDDTWEQERGALRLLFDGGARRLEATLRPGALEQLSGTASPGGSFTAEAIPTYAGAPH